MIGSNLVAECQSQATTSTMAGVLRRVRAFDEEEKEREKERRLRPHVHSSQRISKVLAMIQKGAIILTC